MDSDNDLKVYPEKYPIKIENPFPAFTQPPASFDNVTKDTDMENTEENDVLHNAESNYNTPTSNVNFQEVIDVYKEYLRNRRGTCDKSASLFDVTQLIANHHHDMDAENRNILNYARHFNKTNFVCSEHATFREIQDRMKLINESPINSNADLDNFIGKNKEKALPLEYSLTTKDCGVKTSEMRVKTNECGMGTSEFKIKTKEKCNGIGDSLFSLDKFISKSFSDNLFNFATNTCSCQYENDTKDTSTSAKSLNDNIVKTYEICLLEILGNKLDNLEKILYSCNVQDVPKTYDENTILHLREAMKKMWTRIEDLKTEFDAKLHRVYESDRREKKLFRDNIILNYQNVNKVVLQVQNLEKNLKNLASKNSVQYTEICQNLKVQTTPEKTSFRDLDVFKFIGRHVDFLPVLLMLVMYLVTLILKH